MPLHAEPGVGPYGLCTEQSWRLVHVVRSSAADVPIRNYHVVKAYVCPMFVPWQVVFAGSTRRTHFSTNHHHHHESR